MSDCYDERPWGNYTVLDDAQDHKVKHIVVLPGKRLSYQTHSRRAEHWFIVRGSGVVTLDGSPVAVGAGVAIDVELGVPHRIENTGNDECSSRFSMATTSARTTSSVWRTTSVGRSSDGCTRHRPRTERG